MATFKTKLHNKNISESAQFFFQFDFNEILNHNLKRVPVQRFEIPTWAFGTLKKRNKKVN